ncbi:hypothetical protein HYS48_01120 [Candidatus Woesearchaeota archaeon]|nr:hypothetical protein [Candidatus Woesearchaeota archaeon]
MNEQGNAGEEPMERKPEYAIVYQPNTITQETLAEQLGKLGFTVTATPKPEHVGCHMVYAQYGGENKVTEAVEAARKLSGIEEMVESAIFSTQEKGECNIKNTMKI